MRFLYNSLAVQNPPAGSQEPVRAPSPLDTSTLPKSEQARMGLHKSTRCLLLIYSSCSPLPFLFINNFSDSIFDDVLATLQSLTVQRDT